MHSNEMYFSPDMLEADVLSGDFLPGPVQIVPADPGGQLFHLGDVARSLFGKEIEPGLVIQHSRRHIYILIASTGKLFQITCRLRVTGVEISTFCDGRTLMMHLIDKTTQT